MFRKIKKMRKQGLTFSSTVFLILAPALETVSPALFTAEKRKLPMVLAPATALVDTGNKYQYSEVE